MFCDTTLDLRAAEATISHVVLNAYIVLQTQRVSANKSVLPSALQSRADLCAFHSHDQPMRPWNMPSKNYVDTYVSPWLLASKRPTDMSCISVPHMGGFKLVRILELHSEDPGTVVHKKIAV
jgi:hypothetical protein